MLKALRSVSAAFLSLTLASSSFAAGSANIGNEVLSARSAGQGYVGVAGQNNDPTAVYMNPGAMTNLKGQQISLGAHWENIHGSYESDAGATTKERVVNVLVPNVSATQSFLENKLAVGISAVSPFGLETHWPGNGPMRYVATDSRLGIVDVTPAVAYRIHPMVSIGAGADYVNLFNAQLDKHVNLDAANFVLSQAPFNMGAFSPTGEDANSSLRGQAASWGYHAGLMVEPSPQHAIGVTYHSKVNLRINGNVQLSGLSGHLGTVFGGSDYSTSAYTDLVLPENIQFGYAFKPNDRWAFEADTAWYHWSENKDLNVRFAESDAVRLIFLNAGNPQKFDTRDSWSFTTGANYKATDRWQLRSGFWYEPWGLPESTFTPAIMDLSRYGLSVGSGYDLTEELTVDLAYSAVFMHSRTVHNDLLGAAAGGTYKDFANLLAVNFTYRFGPK